MLLGLFFLLVYGGPLALALSAVFVGLGAPGRGRDLLLTVLLAAVPVGLWAQVQLTDGLTSYARYLRVLAVLALLGCAVQTGKAARRRRARSGSRT